jgi:lipase chaperone LimK
MKSKKSMFYLLGFASIFIGITFVLAMLGRQGPAEVSVEKEVTDKSYVKVESKQNKTIKSLAPQYGKAEAKGGDIASGEVAYYTPKKWDAKSFAPSLAGTEIDGGLKADGHGNLIIDRDIKVFFDYLFLAAPEVGGVGVIDKIKEISSSSLPEGAHNQAMDILEDYLVYKQEISKIDSRSFNGKNRVNALKSTLSEIEGVRNSIFTQEVTDKFFGEEQVYAKYTIKNMEIMADENISVEQRNQMIENNRMTLSEDVRDVMDEAEKEKENYEIVREVSKKSNDPESIKYELISKGVPEKTATRIAERKREENKFNNQYDTYKTELNKYRDLSKSNFESMRSTLVDQYFKKDSERTRAKLKDLSK